MRCCMRLHWMVGLSLLVGLWSQPAMAQESEETIIVVSPRVGEVSDAEERARFQLFPDIPGFQSAVFLRQPDGKVVARVRFLDKGVESIRELGISAAQLSALRELLGPEEERPAGPGPQHQQPVPPSSGQGPLIPGARVRLRAPTVAAQRLIGTVVSVDTATIILRDPSLLMVPWAAVERLEMSQGRRRSGKWTAAGAGIGLLGGGILGVLILNAVVGQVEEEDIPMVFLFTVPVGAVAGLVGGSLIGAIPREQWETVPLSRLRLGMTPLPPRGAATPGIGLVLSVSFP